MSTKRVSFAVTDLLGFTEGDGTAIATTNTTLALSSDGYAIELWYCGPHTPLDAEWAERYVAANIEVRHLDRDLYVHPPFVADSYRLYQQLRSRQHDAIVFQDQHGLGYCSMLAKRAGLAFPTTRLLHLCYGPTEKERAEARRLEFDAHELGYAELERRSAALADAVVSADPSLIDWMNTSGWEVANHHVIPEFRWEDRSPPVCDATMGAWRPLLTPTRPPERAAGSSIDEPLPAVSVIVPHHNQPDMIRTTLVAIADQDYPNLEMVVVDDGSTGDAVATVLDDLETTDWRRPFRLVRQDNRYLGAARNTGVRHALHDLLAFVDDDDLVEPGYIRSMVTAMQALKADVVTTAIHSVKAAHGNASSTRGEEAVWVFLGDAVSLGTVLNVFGGAAALYRRSALAAIGGFHEQHGVGHEDWHALARLALLGQRIVAIPEPLYHARVRSDSMIRTTSTFTNMQPVFDAYHRCLPAPLQVWAQLTRGQQEIVESLRAQVSGLQVARERLVQDVARQDRYLNPLRRVLPLRARSIVRRLVRRQRA